jgi:hypothetical protein
MAADLEGQPSSLKGKSAPVLPALGQLKSSGQRDAERE